MSNTLLLPARDTGNCGDNDILSNILPSDVSFLINKMALFCSSFTLNTPNPIYLYLRSSLYNYNIIT